MSQALSDLDRRLSNLLRYGTIKSVSGDAATVDLDDCVTAPLPWFTARAGGDRSWWSPEVGEQVMVLSPSGELAHGCILPAIYRDAHPAPASGTNVHRVVFGDGTVAEYDREAHALLINTSASSGNVFINTGGGNVNAVCATANISASASVNLDTPVTNCSGALNVAGLITGAGGLAVSGGSGAAATITGNVSVTSGEVTVDGIGVKSHHHIDGDGENTGPALH